MKARTSTRVTAIAGTSILLMAGCGDDSGDPAADGSGDAETVTIGVIGPFEGGFAEIGENILDGAQLAVDHVNEDGGLADGSIVLEIDRRDEQMDPEAATQAARDFINEDTPLITGFLSSADCFAAAPVIDDLGGVFISTTCSSNDLTGILTGEAPYERSYFVASRDIQLARGLAAAVADEFPDIEVFDVFGYDYEVGHEMWETFVDELETEYGMSVEQDQAYWVPLDDTNYRTQVSALSRGLSGEPENRGLFLSMFGAGTAAFLQQSEAFDIDQEYAVMLNSGSYYPVARALDGEAPEIWNSYDYHHEAFDNEVNDRFVADFQEAHDRLPVSWSYQGYTTVLAYAAAIDQAGSGDADAVVEALNGLEWDTPKGTLFMNPDTHLAETDVLIKHTIGNEDAPEGVEFLDAYFVGPEQTLR